MKEFRFPAIAVLNRYLLGDTVLVEPVARGLSLSECSYVVSNYPELYEGHPIIQGVRTYDALPENSRIIDISKSIQSIEGKGEDRHVVPDKFLNMCKEAGFQRALDAPKLYLTSAEMTKAQEMRKFFPGEPCIGVVLGSTHVAKNWIYTRQAIKKFRDKGYHVFVFSDSLSRYWDHTLPEGVYQVVGRSLRDMMVYISMMDCMIGPDTGPMHVAGSLGVPLAVVCFNLFANLYEMYEHHEILASDNFTLAQGIKGVSVNKMVNAVDNLIGSKSRRKLSVGIKKPIKEMKHAFIRMRGLGDVILSLPAIATLQSLNGNSDHSYSYITSPGGKAILECSTMFDEVIGVDYKHNVDGMPLPPSGIDYSKYDTVENLINKIDFIPESDSVPRTELFARAIGVDEIDYDTEWHLNVPESWQDDARELLGERGVRPDDKTIGFLVDTMGLSRQYPKPRQVEFCGLAKKHGWKVVLLSDKRRTRFPQTAINLTGQLSLQQYLAMIAVVDIGVSPDSSMIHIAGAIGKPTVGLFGSVDPDLRIAHYDCIYPIMGVANCAIRKKFDMPCNDWQKGTCKNNKHVPACMWNIKAKDVLQKVEEVSRLGIQGVS